MFEWLVWYILGDLLHYDLWAKIMRLNSSNQKIPTVHTKIAFYKHKTLILHVQFPFSTLMYVCLESHSRIFLLIWRRHHCRWRAANFDLCSALFVIVQSGLFSVPHLQCLWASVYNGHFRGPVTLTTNAEHLVVELFLWLRSVAGWIRTFRLRGERHHRGLL